jgi:DNA-binding HxlR family transcriptional regulator
MNKRSYHQYCGVAKALDVVGERWTLLIVRNLLLGPLRYSELLRGLPGITTNLLAKRLREMEDAGLIEQVRSGVGDTGHAYRLTPFGEDLEPTIHALGRWGWRFLGAPAQGDHRSFEWLLIALRRVYIGGKSIRAELVADGVPYRLVLSERSAEVARGAVREPDVRIKGTGAKIARLFLDPSADRGGLSLEVEGPKGVLDALTTSFDFPRPAGV